LYIRWNSTAPVHDTDERSKSMKFLGVAQLWKMFSSFLSGYDDGWFVIPEP